ncbi:N-acyl homoserine lactonase family protein [Paenibacillus oenotherae]|uniref:N-acyl homoserine lactonase family protein n=1 Tax=Paenibacillus oenotherae TaxID=1435645 RepID=A0ABS7DBL4_9BACL|nr:N-acyl homoserine lactonase family protein [Paenibacillus oenotherae]MBW7477329.1 N-acyl homoserine lactonase family protein [Paenibacillus oenotherae]
MSDSIKVHILHCGHVQVDIAVPFRQNTLNPVAAAGIFRSKKHQVVVPVSAYLIEHPKGLVLIDTGWHTDLRGDQVKYMGRLGFKASKAILPEAKAINEQLLERGITAKELDYVVLSHMDIDHASGLKLVSEAKRILTSDLEWQAASKGGIRYLRHMWEGVPVRTFALEDSEFGPQQKAFDLFGDGSVLFVHTPGHSKGLTSTLIQRNGKFVLLAADTGYAKKSWESMILPGFTVSKRQALESLQWVKEMSLRPNCVEVIANHDPDVRPHTIEL